MSAQEDRERMEALRGDPLARCIHDAIDALPMAQRLYPDLYAVEVADTIRGEGLTHAFRVREDPDFVMDLTDHTDPDHAPGGECVDCAPERNPWEA